MQQRQEALLAARQGPSRASRFEGGSAKRGCGAPENRGGRADEAATRCPIHIGSARLQPSQGLATGAVRGARANAAGVPGAADPGPCSGAHGPAVGARAGRG